MPSTTLFLTSLSSLPQNRLSSYHPITNSQAFGGRNALITVLIALVGSFLMGCVPVTPEVSEDPQLFSCARFGYSHWQEFTFGFDSSPDDLFATVIRLYEVDRDQLHIHTYEGQTSEINWADNNTDHFAHFSLGGQLIDVEVQWGRERPTLAQVINCLGPPDNYHETTNSEGGETEFVHYWADDASEESTLVVEGVSSLTPESSLHANQPEYRVKQLTVFAMPVTQPPVETPEPSSCVKFSVSRWQEFRFGVDSSSDVFATVVTLWGPDKGPILVGGIVNRRFPPIRWNDAEEEIHYMASFVGGKLDRVDVLFDPMPAVDQVIDCLGSPDYYIATGGPGEEATGLQFWYVEKGFVASGLALHTWPWQKPLEAIPPEFGMGRLSVLPAEIEKMARSFEYVDDDGSASMCIFKSWPGSIEAIEIEEEGFSACSVSATD